MKLSPTTHNITIIALGSRGDVQPFVALGMGLQRAGYSVRVAAAEDYRDLVVAYGVPFAPLVGSIQALMDKQMVYAMLEKPENPLRFLGDTIDIVRPVITRLIADVYAACLDSDLVIASTLGYYAAYDVAEALDLSIVTVHVHPNAPTHAYPHLFTPPLPSLPTRLSSRFNYLSYKLADTGYWAFILPPLNAARRDILGMPPVSPAGIIGRVRNPLRPVLHAYSPLLTRTPRDWDSNTYVTGYWLLDEPPNWQPDPALVRFLDAGEPPVYVGFGSILAGRDPDGITEMILRALEKTGQRGIVTSAWGDLGNIPLPSTVLKVGSTPHSWLFPRMRAVVTHGGSGTTGASLLAGVPPVLVPFFGDQLFWGKRVARLGVGPEAISRPTLTEDRLAHAIDRAVNDAKMRERAVVMGRHLAKELGVARAIEILESYRRRA